ncbi:DUF535 family protein [Caenimonas terrae]|uniref:DUF535 family protein n=1 Tax=Caenimonas terrae TaxID=696074 RepID=A0ABW0NAQ6_9BURK
MAKASSNRMPSVWSGIPWALAPASGDLASRLQLATRALRGALWHGKAMRRWMAMVYELRSRGIISDLPNEYLRAVQPYVNSGTSMPGRVVQLIDHADWLETALKPAAYERLTSGKPLILATLAAPRGYEYMRLQLQRAPAQSPEGELMLTLVLQRAQEVQQRAAPMEAATLAFSRFRIEGQGCFVIGGVRGQRHPVLRLSPVELNQALSGWKPAVLMVRVAQELARFWGLKLVGLDPARHPMHGRPYRWSRRYREVARQIDKSYGAIWNHFEAVRGDHGWMVLPLDSDEKLAATALSPEKRARQSRRADYWIRTRNLLRTEFAEQLNRLGAELALDGATVAHGPDTLQLAGAGAFEDSDEIAPSRALDTGPSSLL